MQFALYTYQGSSRHKPNLSVVHGFGLRNYDIHALSALCALHDLAHRVVLVACINNSCPWNVIRAATCRYDATSCLHLSNHQISQALLIQPKIMQCIRVDEGSGEGPGHAEVLFRLTIRHLIRNLLPSHLSLPEIVGLVI